MKKFLVLLTVVLGILFFCESLYSQQQQPVDKSIDGKYIIIDNFNDFFIEKDPVMESQYFYLSNIDDSESSKPYYEKISEIKEVDHFSLESRSGKYEMQRRCHIRIDKANYKSTFMKILTILDVKYILYNGSLVNLDEFYSIIK
ncbi:MAG: hypothetical protein LBQ22_04825 [Bacteroidales bacterium]|jgi:hypothetical protein|nr:hypothetical protein [Bacteroidales bacterium]